jgi:hypothetical protein
MYCRGPSAVDAGEYLPTKRTSSHESNLYRLGAVIIFSLLTVRDCGVRGLPGLSRKGTAIHPLTRGVTWQGIAGWCS